MEQTNVKTSAFLPHTIFVFCLALPLRLTEVTVYFSEALLVWHKYIGSDTRGNSPFSKI